MISFCIELFEFCILGISHSLDLLGNGLCSALHLASSSVSEVVVQLGQPEPPEDTTAAEQSARVVGRPPSLLLNDDRDGRSDGHLDD